MPTNDEDLHPGNSAAEVEIVVFPIQKERQMPLTKLVGSVTSNNEYVS
jgi:hypothetical protein